MKEKAQGIKKKFPSMAKFVKDARLKLYFSQSELSEKIGFKNGQAVSNTERELATIPPKKAKLLCEVLGISKEEYIEAHQSDNEAFLREILK